MRCRMLGLAASKSTKLTGAGRCCDSRKKNGAICAPDSLLTPISTDTKLLRLDHVDGRLPGVTHNGFSCCKMMDSHT